MINQIKKAIDLVLEGNKPETVLARFSNRNEFRVKPEHFTEFISLIKDMGLVGYNNDIKIVKGEFLLLPAGSKLVYKGGSGFVVYGYNEDNYWIDYGKLLGVLDYFDEDGNYDDKWE